ncbi:MAG: helix-turn-helix transcriptional regulator [Mollicutes bacterium]|nr:helix-turn-helix transcriptional regulator [Mollicutes bacterium]
MNIDKSMIGKILRKMRLDNNFSQRELAEKLFVTQTTLSDWERAYRQPTFDSIAKIAYYCDYTISFTNNKTGEVITTENIVRKDL